MQPEGPGHVQPSFRNGGSSPEPRSTTATRTTSLIAGASRPPIRAKSRSAARRPRSRGCCGTTAFGSKVVILDEPTAALGVRESRQVLKLITDLRNRGLPVILISHNMPHVFDVADRIHIQRLGRRVAVVTPESHSMSQAVAIMTGAAAA